MSIQKQIFLRYRSANHLRFQLPADICAGGSAEALQGELHRIEGVYRVTLYRRQCKLSIRFFDTATDASQVLKQMYQILGELIEEGVVRKHAAKTDATASSSKARPKRHRPRRKIKQSRLTDWLRGKIQEGRETVTALKVLAKRGGGKNAPAFLQNPENAAFEFANDVLVFYLIKSHWQRIVHEWLPNPLRHRYEWLAVIYMTYLWVRWRHSKD